MFKNHTPLVLLGIMLWSSFSLAFGDGTIDDSHSLVDICPEPPFTLHPAARTVADVLSQRLPWHDRDKVRALANEVRALADDGLSPDHYHVSWLDTLDAQAQLDACETLLTSQIYAQAVSDLALGKVDAHKEGLVWYQQPISHEERVRILSALIRAEQSPQAVFNAARPQFASYRHLRAAYVAAREGPSKEPLPRVPTGESLKEGVVDERVVPLRARLAAWGYEVEGNVPPTHFDAILRDAVKAFQRRHGLEADGVVGKKTLAELNRDADEWLTRMRVNLERLRWLARDMAPRALIVDIAAARILFYHDGVLVWSSRAQMGMASRPTPALVSSLTHVTLNPTWTVPPTIFRNDKLPEIRKDISYLAKNRLKVLDREGNVLDPRYIDWHKPVGIVLRQDAGPQNALGRIAFRFPNPFAVYLHDTPNQRLFHRAERFFSSGCVRVESALKMAELLFSGATDDHQSRFSRILSAGKTSNLDLPQPVLLIMGYWTAEADAQGQVFFRPDVYDLDQKLSSLLQKK